MNTAADRESAQLTGLNCGLLRLDGERRLRGVNTAVTHWTGLAQDALLGKGLAALLAPGSVVYWETIVEPMLLKQGHAWDVALELRTHAGELVAVLVNVRVDGDATHCVLFPFSERRRYERQLLAAQTRARRQKAEIDRLVEVEAFRRDFVNRAAHEFATPMTPLQIQFHLLKRALAGYADPKVQRSIAAMGDNLNKLAKFSTALMASANVDAARIGMSMVPIALDARVPELAASWRFHYARERDIVVHGAPATIQADEAALATCLGNLLENASKFSSPGTPIEITVEPGPPVRITVADHGRGIDPALIEGLGRPFVQAHDQTEMTMLGAGLGLHIVSGLMKAQGGRLIIHSEGRETGTDATLEFPVSAEAVAPEPRMEADAEQRP